LTKTRRVVSVAMVLSNPATHDPRPVKEAQTLARAGYAVTILAWDREGETKSDSITGDGVLVKRMRLFAGHGTPVRTVPKLLVFYAWCLMHLLGSRADVIHCHDVDTLPVGLTSKVIGAGRTKLVYDMHDLPEAFLRFFPLSGVLQKVFLSMARTTADLVVSASEGYVSHLRKAGFRMRRTILVLNAPSLSEGRQPRPRLGNFGVLYYGALEEERGVRLLVEAARDLEGVTLTVAGRGRLNGWMTRVAKESRNIEFLGWLNLTELSTVIEKADLIPSYYEPKTTNILLSTPNKLLMSFALSTPALVASGTFQAELVRRYGCGLTVTWGRAEEVRNAIAGLAGDRQAYSGMASIAYAAFRSELNWEVMEATLKGAYATMLRE
jgi:glycosyltransferase involved in cell wall biosynthesis